MLAHHQLAEHNEHVLRAIAASGRGRWSAPVWGWSFGPFRLKGL